MLQSFLYIILFGPFFLKLQVLPTHAVDNIEKESDSLDTMKNEEFVNDRRN